MTLAIASKHRSPSGFTLVEVMISLALVLLLIIGINQAFKTVTDTVGVGQTMSGLTRDNRAIQPVLYTDLRGMVTQNQPAFIIAASRVSAFRNRADQAGDRDFGGAGTEAAIRSIDLNDDHDEIDAPVAPSPFGETISPATYNFRSHRTDRLAFFARDVFRRQTGNPGQFSNGLTSGEAWIWYGHLRLQNNPPAPIDFLVPGELPQATNPNNFHACDFALGRMVMLLRAEDAAGDIEDNATPPVAQYHIDRVPAATPLSPLAFGSPSVPPAFSVVELSRLDLGGTTIDEYFTDVLTAAGRPYAAPAIPTADPFWWQRLLYDDTVAYAAIAAPLANTRDYRFAANRYFAKPLDSDKSARMAPILANGGPQFIVEFAGDYIGQTDAPGDATDGDITTALPDGITDFVVEQNAGAAATWKRRTRWYGMPRDVAPWDPATTVAINGGPDGAIQLGTAADPPVDVLPVRDLRGLSPVPPPALPPRQLFERFADIELPPAADYLAPGAVAPEARYTCVWGPDVDPARDPLPRMIRITIVLDEPAGRLAEGQTYEYVIDLP